jgi:hypothetical protein
MVMMERLHQEIHMFIQVADCFILRQTGQLVLVRKIQAKDGLQY